MMGKLFGLLYLVFGFATMLLNAQSNSEGGTIQGYVFDSLTNEPVIGANVFINNTTIGAATDIEGNYIIKNVKPGIYDLVFSHVTYDYRSMPINVAPEGLELKPVAMIPNVRALAEITIKGRNDREWKRNLGFFEKYFLGSSLNANKCTIKNPEVLDFEYDSKTKVTKVIANSELIIENEALGYRLYYVLEAFEFDEDYKIMLGKSRFETLDPPNLKTENKWQRERKRTYEGSIQHFFKSLVVDDLEENGFRIYRLDKLPQSTNEPRYAVTARQLMTFGGPNLKRKLYFPGVLEIIYEREAEPLAYRNQRSGSRNDARNTNIQNVETGSSQTSMVKLRGQPLAIDKDGYIFNPTGYIVYGYWAWERIAELMPFDYEPQ